MEKRKSGYYWTRLKMQDWDISWWDGSDSWHDTDGRTIRSDSCFIEIDERLIVREGTEGI